MTAASQNDDPDGVDYEDVAYVVASHYRLDTLQVLADSPSTPSHIQDESGNDISHVSKALRELRGRGLAELLVPEDTSKGRIHDITHAGQQVLETARGVNGADQ